MNKDFVHTNEAVPAFDILCGFSVTLKWNEHQALKCIFDHGKRFAL